MHIVIGNWTNFYGHFPAQISITSLVTNLDSLIILWLYKKFAQDRNSPHGDAFCGDEELVSEYTRFITAHNAYAAGLESKGASVAGNSQHIDYLSLDA